LDFFFFFPSFKLPNEAENQILKILPHNQAY